MSAHSRTMLPVLLTAGLLTSSGAAFFAMDSKTSDSSGNQSSSITAGTQHQPEISTQNAGSLKAKIFHVDQQSTRADLKQKRDGATAIRWNTGIPNSSEKLALHDNDLSTYTEQEYLEAAEARLVELQVALNETGELYRSANISDQQVRQDIENQIIAYLSEHEEMKAKRLDKSSGMLLQDILAQYPGLLDDYQRR